MPNDQSVILGIFVVLFGLLVWGRSAQSLNLLYRHSVTLLGVSRSGLRFSDRVRLLKIKPGDVLLLLRLLLVWLRQPALTPTHG
jgi:hypothetical protein